MGLALRDVSAELWLHEDPLWLSFAVCTTILAMSAAYVLLRGQRTLLRKLRTPGAPARVLGLGLFSGGIYFGIFFLIGRLGAGLWGLIDYGLIPLATALVGWALFDDHLTIDFFAAFAVYATGLTILMLARGGFIGVDLLAIAVLLPVASALSDGFTKWLLDPTKANLTKSELLVVRFLPAVVTLYFVGFLSTGSSIPRFDSVTKTVLVSAAFGWAPLMLLCTGLGIAGMTKLA